MRWRKTIFSAPQRDYDLSKAAASPIPPAVPSDYLARIESTIVTGFPRQNSGCRIGIFFCRMVKKLCAVKGGDFQWVRSPPGDGSLQPVAIGALEEVTNPTKPLMERIALAIQRACRPKRE